MITMTKRLLGSAALSLLMLGGCKDTPQPKTPLGVNAKHIETETAALNAWFDERYKEDLARSPMTKTYLGLPGDQDKLDDASQAAIDEEYALYQARIADMHEKFNFDRLDKQGQISYRLYEYDGNIAKALHPYADDDYVFNLMEGAHSDFPTFMVNFHKVKTPKDARNYIARLNAAKTYLGQNRERAQAQFEKGVFLPKFTYDRMINAAQNVITGAPFDTGKDSPLYADIKAKIDGLDIDDDTKSALLEDARQALLNSIGPAYRDIITMFETHKKTATDEDGAWKLPNGDAYYQSRLKYYTTTNLTAEQIHQIGLKEVARIQAEMHKIMDQVGFKGSLQDFYAFLRTDPQFTYPNTDEGRAQYMQEATQIIADMRARLNDLFITKPKADIIVKRVEPFREATAFGAFYDQPSLDGSRPGTYFINLRNMKDQPIYLMQALAYHEGIPGHHMQIAIAQELTGIPEFRKQGGYTSYVEGWALYAESVPAELGLYTDPYKDFGRLSMEIFRAARLVVDTGIHSQKWTREQAVQYMLKNIANPEGDIRAEIDRYIVWPGQATAYKIGMLKIIELRENAKKKLGDKFDIREFHDIVLTSGPVPLAILEEMVDEWVKSKG